MNQRLAAGLFAAAAFFSAPLQADDYEYQDEIIAPDGWFIASQDPCDGFITFQNIRRANINFTFAFFPETETNSIDSIASLLLKNLNCLNPQIRKNEIGAHVINCENSINIDIWEENLDNPELSIYSAIISANQTREELNPELPRMLQVSLQYQRLALDYLRSNRCPHSADLFDDSSTPPDEEENPELQKDTDRIDSSTPKDK